MLLRAFIIAICHLIMALADKVHDVHNLNYEPKIAIKCGKVAKYINVNTGKWTDDSNKEEFCPSDTSEILKFCKKTYPDIDVTNIVEDNENVTICSEESCQSSYTVAPYRCLVGEFEADALSYPFDANCVFGHVQESHTCKSHTYWHGKAKEICNGKSKHLRKYGILIPCGTDVFTGVEYVCCEKPEISVIDEDVEETEKPKTDHEILEDLIDKFAGHIPKKSKGCDRSMYSVKSDLLHQEKNTKVKSLAKNLNEAKARMLELKKDDGDQAKDFFKKSLKIFQSTLDNIEKQASLDESRLSQEKKECIQMNLNHKKHRAMTAFVDAVRKHGDKPAKVVKTFQRFMNVLKNDQDQNMRSLSKTLLAKGAKKIMSARDLFLSHLKLVKNSLKEGVEILRKVDSVAGKIEFDLPEFASDIDFEFAHKPKTTAPPPTTAAPATRKPVAEDSSEPLGLNDEERQPENEHKKFPKPGKTDKLTDNDEHDHHNTRDHPLKSRAVFAAVIGLSCGALVIMIVIVLALFFRKGSSKRSTKTVIADDDSVEKRHLLKMQEDGFENPTYKFFAN